MATASTPAPTSPATPGWRAARVTAPLARALAGRRFFPLWAVVHHVGRRSGRALSVPVAVRVAPDCFVIVLPWGPGTNWVRNVLAAGRATVTWRGADHAVHAPEIIGPARARAYFGAITWRAVERVLGADSFLRVRREP